MGLFMPPPSCFVRLLLNCKKLLAGAKSSILQLAHANLRLWHNYRLYTRTLWIGRLRAKKVTDHTNGTFLETAVS